MSPSNFFDIDILGWMFKVCRLKCTFGYCITIAIAIFFALMSISSKMKSEMPQNRFYKIHKCQIPC